MRQRLVVGNFKLNKTCAETTAWLTQVHAHAVLNDARLTCVVAPPATALYAAQRHCPDGPIKLAVQAICAHDKGAFTGEISAPLAKEAGAHYALVGHSERRSLFHASDADVHAQLMAAHRAQLVPIVCVGESAQQRQQGETEKIITTQLANACGDGLRQTLKRIVIAYEPVWAIGTGDAPKPWQAQQAHALLRSALCELGAADADSIPIIYGGSVTAKNAQAFAQQQDIDGVLVGGASLDPTSFVDTARAVIGTSL